MAICKFYQQGGCKFGDRCYNDHVDPQRNNCSQPQRYANQKQAPRISSGFSFTKAFEQVTRVEPEIGRNVQFDDSRNRFQSNYRQEGGYRSDPKHIKTVYQPPSATTGFGFVKAFNQIHHQPILTTSTPQHDVDMSTEMSNSESSMFPSFTSYQSQNMYASPPHQVSSISCQPSVLDFSASSQSMGDPQSVVTSNSIEYGKEYSLITDLSSQELEAFKAESFSLGKIPLKPPPLQLCK